MGPDEDDFEEHEPLPDPTLRAWRHPSELAAVAAMAARDEPGPPRRRLAYGSLLLGGALGAVAALAVLTASGLVGSEPAAPRLDLRDQTSIAPDEPPDPDATPDSDGEPSTSTTDAGSDPPPPTTPTTAPTAGPLPTLEGLDDELAAAGLPPVPGEAVVGVAVHDAEVARPRCTGLVVDQLVVTSASAIGKATEVTLVIAGAAYPATVVGRDRFTDIAVLDPAADAPLHALSPAPAAATDAAVAVVSTDGRPEPIAIVGRITGWDQVGATADGQDLFGLVTTSARLPRSGAGSPLLDPSGGLLGMVVNTPGHLAAAVPEATLRAVVGSLRDHGHPVPVWLGVKAREVGPRVVVDRVIAGGPAAAAGLQEGDVVVALGDTPVSDLTAFFAAVRARQAGEDLSITVDRGGTTVVLDAVLSTPPPPDPPTAGEQAAD